MSTICFSSVDKVQTSVMSHELFLVNKDKPSHGLNDSSMNGLRPDNEKILLEVLEAR